MEQNYTGRKLEICREILEVLSQYIDQELPDNACSQVDAYVGSCEKRREFVRSLRNTVELCRSFELEAEPKPLRSEAKAELLKAYQRAMKHCAGA